MNPGRERAVCEPREGVRHPIPHLLHALNQPLTGLQCSLELALARPQTAEQYVATLHTGLELTGRMRLLVEALRDLADAQAEGANHEKDAKEKMEEIALDALLREVVADLRPVAESRGVGCWLEGSSLLTVAAERQSLASVIFKFLESALALAAKGSVLEIAAHAEKGVAKVTVRWNQTHPAPEHSPFSRPELGLLLAQAEWQRAGGEWCWERSADSQIVRAQMPLASSLHPIRQPGAAR